MSNSFDARSRQNAVFQPQGRENGCQKEYIRKPERIRSTWRKALRELWDAAWLIAPEPHAAATELQRYCDAEPGLRLARKVPAVTRLSM